MWLGIFGVKWVTIFAFLWAGRRAVATRDVSPVPIIYSSPGLCVRDDKKWLKLPFCPPSLQSQPFVDLDDSFPMPKWQITIRRIMIALVARMADDLRPSILLWVLKEYSYFPGNGVCHEGQSIHLGRCRVCTAGMRVADTHRCDVVTRN